MQSRRAFSLSRSVAEEAQSAAWIVLAGGASLLFSFVFACATPFPALAAIAGAAMSRRDGLLLVGGAWLANQAIGFLLLGYPWTGDTLGWGLAIGVAAMLATMLVGSVPALRGPGLGRLGVALLAAFAAYEVVLFGTRGLLPSGDEAFSLPIVGELFAINALALAGLWVLQCGAALIGLVRPLRGDAAVLARA